MCLPGNADRGIVAFDVETFLHRNGNTVERPPFAFGSLFEVLGPIGSLLYEETDTVVLVSHFQSPGLKKIENLVYSITK